MQGALMKRVLVCVLACILSAGPVFAEQRIIVRALGGQPVLNTVCLLLGCNVVGGLEDPLGQVFLLGIADTVNLSTFLARLSGIIGIVNVEPDTLGTVLDSRPPIPSPLYDSHRVPYFGVNVHRGYILQPA